VQALVRWVEGHRTCQEIDWKDLDELHGLILALGRAEPLELEARQRVLSALLDVMGMQAVLPEPVQLGSGRLAAAPTRERTPKQLAKLAAAAQFERGSSPRLELWLANEFVLPGLRGEIDARPARARCLAGLELLGTQRADAVLPALMECASSADEELSQAALAALVGWRSAAVDRFLIGRLERLACGDEWPRAAALARHFQGSQVALGADELARLADLCRRGLIDPDWRTVVRALGVARALPDEWIAPALIESLAVWVERRGQALARLRLETELVAELEQRSGRNIGPHPERWAVWWSTRRSGKGAPRDAAEAQAATRAGFFGLRPQSDRICFVLDASGSMNSPFEGSERTRYGRGGDGSRGGPTRYQEALTQMEAFLRGLGPTARFRVVCFNFGARAWRRDLAFVTDTSLREARAWAAAQGPDGATELQAGVFAALHYERGRVRLEDLEEDTLIVLCDGETAEGAAWVEPFFQTVGPATCITVHAVQIGGASDGALQAMARATGGDYVQVGS
jgi:hypothetical protein